MKKYLRLYLFNLISLWLVVNIVEGVKIKGGFQSLVLTTLALTLINLLVKPIINILFLPINLITLGIFRWVVNVIALYLVTLIVPDFVVTGFVFPGFSWQVFHISKIYLSTFWVFVITSFIISFITSFLLWVSK